MEKAKKIEGTKCNNYPNSLHAEFHERTYAALKSAVLTKLNITDAMMGEYKKLIDEEINLNLEAQRSASTQTLAQADALRDADLAFILGTVDLALLSPVKASRDAATTLSVALQPYRKIAGEGMEAETLHIKGLLADLEKTECAAAVTALALGAVVTDLKKYNDLFVSTTAERDAERAARLQSTMKATRPETDAAYARLCTLVGAGVLLLTAEADRTMVSDLIDRMNVITTDLKARWKSSLAATRTARDKKNAEEAARYGLTVEEYLKRKKDGTLPVLPGGGSSSSASGGGSSAPKVRPEDIDGGGSATPVTPSDGGGTGGGTGGGDMAGA